MINVPGMASASVDPGSDWMMQWSWGLERMGLGDEKQATRLSVPRQIARCGTVGFCWGETGDSFCDPLSIFESIVINRYLAFQLRFVKKASVQKKLCSEAAWMSERDRRWFSEHGQNVRTKQSRSFRSRLFRLKSSTLMLERDRS